MYEVGSLFVTVVLRVIDVQMMGVHYGPCCGCYFLFVILVLFCFIDVHLISIDACSLLIPTVEEISTVTSHWDGVVTLNP
jgi:hypothetical protein